MLFTLIWAVPLILFINAFPLHKVSAFKPSDTYVIWFDSYLTGHYFVVWTHNVYSTPFEVLYGVPQGSVLGTLLFNLLAPELFF